MNQDRDHELDEDSFTDSYLEEYGDDFVTEEQLNNLDIW